jgi:hypothetical protein
MLSEGSNKSLELTTRRRTIQLSMNSTRQSAAMRSLARGGFGGPGQIDGDQQGGSCSR